jgi:hypothetical protein
VVQALGKTLKVSDENSATVRQSLEHLSRVNPQVLEQLRSSGLTLLELSDKPMTEMDQNQHLRGVVPRGWQGSVDLQTGKQHTWDNVPGSGASTANPQITWGNGSAGHGSRSGVLHEVGHGFGQLMGWDTHPEVKQAYDQAMSGGRLNPYFKQAPPAGQQEFLAEAVAVHAMDGPRATERQFGRAMAEFLDKQDLRA